MGRSNTRVLVGSALFLSQGVDKSGCRLGPGRDGSKSIFPSGCRLRRKDNVSPEADETAAREGGKRAETVPTFTNEVPQRDGLALRRKDFPASVPADLASTKQAMRSITFDRGSEFAEHADSTDDDILKLAWIASPTLRPYSVWVGPIPDKRNALEKMPRLHDTR